MSLRNRVLAGERVLGGMVFEFFSPGMAQIMATAGAEYVIYDMEHSGASIETLKWQAAACRGLGITPLARPPVSDYRLYRQAVGCRG